MPPHEFRPYRRVALLKEMNVSGGAVSKGGAQRGLVNNPCDVQI